MSRFSTLLAALCLLGTAALSAQSYTVELKPGEASGDDVFYYSGSTAATQASTTTPRFQISEWTRSGARTEQTNLLRFDLSLLPANAEIESAKLSMYFDPDNTDGRGYGHYGDVPTDFYINRVMEDWAASTTTYVDRPAVSDEDRILLPGHTAIDQSYEDIDVTAMVRKMAAGENYGFYFQMASEDIYQVIKFASSNHPNAELHPKLEITYSAARCGTFAVTDGAGGDANMWSGNPDQNYGKQPSLTVYGWTNGGRPAQKRAFLNFDLSPIGEGRPINSAELFLYYLPGTTDINGVHSGNTDLVINPVTEAWTDTLVTWNTQPAVDESTTVTVTGPTNERGDLKGIEVTELMRGIRASGNPGFRIRMADESPRSGVLLASGNHPQAAYHPTLKVCWDAAVSTKNTVAPGYVLPDVYPNPNNGQFTIDFTDVPAGNLTYKVTDLSGRQVSAPVTVAGRGTVTVNLTNKPRGTYVVTSLLNGRFLASKRVVTLTKQ